MNVDHPKNCSYVILNTEALEKPKLKKVGAQDATGDADVAIQKAKLDKKKKQNNEAMMVMASMESDDEDDILAGGDNGGNDGGGGSGNDDADMDNLIDEIDNRTCGPAVPLSSLARAVAKKGAKTLDDVQ